ncbi:hypothetical protein GMH39_23840 [Escherichia coli]|nr:hypothetical protein [Escherichia coli]
MKKTAPDGAVSGMPAIRETGPGKNLQAITVSRKRFGSPKFRVWGGKPMIMLILVFGVGNALVHILSSFNLLPVYQ